MMIREDGDGPVDYSDQTRPLSLIIITLIVIIIITTSIIIIITTIIIMIITITREDSEVPVDYSDQPPDHPAPSLPLEVIRQNTPSYR